MGRQKANYPVSVDSGAPTLKGADCSERLPKKETRGKLEVNMPYVRRDARGGIESVHRTSSHDAIEYLDADDPQISEFFEQASGTATGLDPQLPLLFDATMDVLLAKGVMSIAELPPDAQAAWLLRKELKARQERKRFAASGFVEIIDDSAFGSLRR